MAVSNSGMTGDLPDGVVDKIHFYGVLETPRDLIKFWCGGYAIKGNLITIYDVIVDTAVTRKSALLRAGQLYYERIEFIGYMAVFTPFKPYKLRE